MIVRISTEGQYRLPDGDLVRLNQLDDEAVRAVEAGDEPRFHELWDQMIALIETDGEALPGDELVHSDIILPPRDLSFDEARHGFSGEGLIPERV